MEVCESYFYIVNDIYSSRNMEYISIFLKYNIWLKCEFIYSSTKLKQFLLSIAFSEIKKSLSDQGLFSIDLNTSHYI